MCNFAKLELLKENLLKYFIVVNSPNEFDNDFYNHGYAISYSFNNLFLMSLVLFNTPQIHFKQNSYIKLQTKSLCELIYKTKGKTAR